MKKLMATSVGIAGAFAVFTLFGAGTAAAAPDVVGQTYADASAAIEDDGGTPKVASRVGSFLSEDECVVTNAWDATFVRDNEGEFSHADSEVMVALNCNGGVATAKNPGASAASPEGRKSMSAIQDAADAEEGPTDEISEGSTGGLPTVDGVPCTGRDIGKCLGLAQNAE